MSRLTLFDQKIYPKFLSEKTKHRSEVVIIYIAIASFLIHLLLIVLVDFEFISLNDYSDLLSSPIAAIYTPFSFILIYEVYLLIFYLPYSITTYIGKQYEIIMLILIRRLFKDLSALELSSDWFKIKDDLQFTFDIIAAVVIFFLIYIFNRLNGRRKRIDSEEADPADHPVAVRKFIRIKKYMAVLLVPLLLGLALYSLVRWIGESFYAVGEMVKEVKDINNIFFDEFFTALILIDVLLLLFSLLHTDKFHKVIRNSGFIISTILIRLSFSVEGLLNIALVTVAVLFGVVILWIHNQYEKIIATEKLPVDKEEMEL